jgi:hypothetical protein
MACVGQQTEDGSTEGGAARGVCVALNNTCQIKLTSAYATSQAPLTLVLGADYRMPTAEPAPAESNAG